MCRNTLKRKASSKVKLTFINLDFLDFESSKFDELKFHLFLAEGSTSTIWVGKKTLFFLSDLGVP